MTRSGPLPHLIERPQLNLTLERHARRRDRISLRPTPNPTWTDLKQLLWAWLLVLPFIALASYGARELLGWSTAIRMGVGLAGLVTVALLLVVATSFIMSHVHDWLARRRERRELRARGRVRSDRGAL